MKKYTEMNEQEMDQFQHDIMKWAADQMHYFNVRMMEGTRLTEEENELYWQLWGFFMASQLRTIQEKIPNFAVMPFGDMVGEPQGDVPLH